MLPALARRIVEEYSTSDALVVDPMAGIGTTLVEAAAIGRRAVGVELESRWVALARQNLGCTLSSEQRALASIMWGDCLGCSAIRRNRRPRSAVVLDRGLFPGCISAGQRRFFGAPGLDQTCDAWHDSDSGCGCE
jgi:modification methylase